MRTFQRDSEGRYMVSLPFKDGPAIGESRSKAVKRLEQMEHRLYQNLEKLKRTYDLLQQQDISTRECTISFGLRENARESTRVYDIF